MALSEAQSRRKFRSTYSESAVAGILAITDQTSIDYLPVRNRHRASVGRPDLDSLYARKGADFSNHEI